MFLILVAATAFADPAAPATWTPSAAEQEVIRAFSARDAGPACADVESKLTDPVASLLAIVSNVEMPPTVPMRAADCLITGHAAAIQPTLETWVTDPALKGLGILALNRLDAMPQTVAVPVAQAALTRGPDPASAKTRIGRSTNPVIAALASAQP